MNRSNARKDFKEDGMTVKMKFAAILAMSTIETYLFPGFAFAQAWRCGNA